MLNIEYRVSVVCNNCECVPSAGSFLVFSDHRKLKEFIIESGWWFDVEEKKALCKVCGYKEMMKEVSQRTELIRQGLISIDDFKNGW